MHFSNIENLASSPLSAKNSYKSNFQLHNFTQISKFDQRYIPFQKSNRPDDKYQNRYERKDRYSSLKKPLANSLMKTSIFSNSFFYETKALYEKTIHYRTEHKIPSFRVIFPKKKKFLIISLYYTVYLLIEKKTFQKKIYKNCRRDYTTKTRHFSINCTIFFLEKIVEKIKIRENFYDFHFLTTPRNRTRKKIIEKKMFSFIKNNSVE